MWGYLAGGVIATATGLYLFFDSHKLRVGDTAFVPGNKAIQSTLGVSLPTTLPEAQVLVIKRDVDKVTGIVKNLAGGIQPEVSFAVADVLRIVRGNGKPFPGGK